MSIQRRLNRKRMSIFLIITLLAALVAVIPASAAQSPQVPLPGSAIPQFAQSLPLLSVQQGTINTVIGNQALTVTMCEFDANVLPPGTFTAGVQPTTRVWGYIVGSTCPSTPQDTYIGPVIVNDRGSSTDITWVNNLGEVANTQVLAYKYSTDQTMHWADPLNSEANNCMEKVATSGWTVNGVPQNYPPPGDPCAENYDGSIPAVVHLHGGEVPPEIDGGPDAWFTSDGAKQGHGYYTFPGAPTNGATYKYPNTQEAGPLWFHDHTLGATRLNVYAGLAGAYYLEDPGLWSTNRSTTRGTTGTCAPGAGCLPDNLQSIGDVVPLVIQDRMFDTNGQLFFPSDTAANVLWTPNPEHPYWVPEFAGDVIVVNGKAWPFHNVEPKRYRFLFLNGSNARTYEMSLPGNIDMWVIGTDGGYLDAPVNVKKLVMMPGERYEVIIDFGKAKPGTSMILQNTAKTPFPAGAPPQGATTGKIMQFRIIPCQSAGGCSGADPSYNPATGIPLRAGANAIVRLPAVGSVTRQLTLNEVMGMPQTVINPVTGLLTAYAGGPLEILVNNTKWSGMSPRTYDDFTPITVNGITTAYSELPTEGTTEVWEIINLTADAHPIHLHLVQFQIINRQAFRTNQYNGAYNAAFPAVPGDPVCIGGVFCPGFGPPLDYNTGNPLALGGNPDITPYLQGKASPPAANEAGWKDTVIAYPGQVTRIVVRWAPTDLPTSTTAANLYYPFDPNDGSQHGYVWHCHIIDHEDNEMMRPDVVQLNPAAPGPASRPLVKGTAY